MYKIKSIIKNVLNATKKDRTMENNIGLPIECRNNKYIVNEEHLIIFVKRKNGYMIKKYMNMQHYFILLKTLELDNQEIDFIKMEL